ncbi:4-alpha-glucanotransferase [Pseudomonas sp. EA_35y_Pfl2_R5]|uniref:4-alpha-glucanotransferase n=1 Tax=Pseudomonas sp. EA_35y_Pfl2_R5 TaxID=3088690 RepID=UPI0030D9BA20
MSDALLAELAKSANLCIDWTDAFGHDHVVSPQVQRSLLEALGYQAQTPEQIRASLSALAQQNHERAADGLLIQDLGQPLPLNGFAAHTSYLLTNEQGDMRSGQLDHDARLPALDQPGYYQLQIGDNQHRLAVAPAACLSVEQLCAKRHIWGLTAQVYGLRRPGDGGLGDTQAVADLARHAANQGADALALSPLHALFSANHEHYSPYSPSSRLFFNALHAAPSGLLGRERVQRAVLACGIQAELNHLESQDLINWPAVAEVRQRLLRQLYRDFKQNPGELLNSFQRFCAAGGDALLQHCRFEAIHQHRMQNGESTDWRTWPADLRSPEQAAVSQFAAEHAECVEFHAFAQWLVAHGLEAAQASACGAGMKIGLIADLAVGADCSGSQAWSRQDELLPQVTVGAPPDVLNRNGQNWGVNAFSPGGLRQHGFRAYIEMLQANLAHAGGIRIDHVMGLQRLWVIPQGGEPQDGAYLRYPLNDLLRLLALESHRHRALVIGEDLGTVPHGLRENLAARNILGTRVLLFEQHEGRFVPPERWPRDALATTTTHDLPSINGWFAGHDIDWRVRAGHSQAAQLDSDHAERNRERSALVDALDENGQLQGNRDDTEACLQASIGYIGSTPAVLTLLPLEDACGAEQQPNLPGPGNEHPNWRRRYTLPVREMLEQPLVRQRLERLAAARRGLSDD